MLTHELHVVFHEIIDEHAHNHGKTDSVEILLVHEVGKPTVGLVSSLESLFTNEANGNASK